MHIPRAICGADNREMVTSKTGNFVEMVASWGSYYKIAADEYTCPECNATTVLLASMPVIENYQPGYAEHPTQRIARFDS